MTQKSKILGRRVENRDGNQMYLEPCTTARGAVEVSVDPVSTSMLSLETELDKEVQRNAIQVGLA